MIDTSELPVVDVHCHPFYKPPTVNLEQFTDSVSIGGGSPEYMAAGGVTINDDVLGELQRIKRDTVYFRYLVHQLADFFDCAPDLEHIVDERNNAVNEDYPGADTPLRGLVMDPRPSTGRRPKKPIRRFGFDAGTWSLRQVARRRGDRPAHAVCHSGTSTTGIPTRSSFFLRICRHVANRSEPLQALRRTRLPLAAHPFATGAGTPTGWGRHLVGVP